jgi:hypothetical protein
MKKLLMVLGVCAVIGAGALFVMASRINGIVKGAVETFAPEVIGAPVTLAAVKLSPFSGKGELRGLVIGNPPGFTTPSAFELDTVRIAVDPKSLLSDVIVIDEIYIEGPRVTYEASLKGSNMARIMANVEKFTGPGAPSKTGEAPKEEGSEVRIRIKRFDFLEGQAAIAMSAKLLKGKKLSAPLPGVKLRDIGGEKGATPAEAAKQVMKPVLSSVIRSGKKAVSNATGGVQDAAKKGLKTLKGLFGK